MAYIGTPPANRPLTSFDIGENNITSFNISEAVIETLDIVNSSVTEAKLADSSVTTAKLATNYVGNVTAGTGLILVGNTYTITNSGMAAYTIDGSSNPSLALLRGHTYTFNVSASGHPFWIKTANVIGTGSAYSTGVTNNGTESGTITFTVPSNAPATLYYQCQVHLPMYGTINVSNVSKNANITIGVADSGNVTVSQLPLSGITAGTYGNATSIPAVTVNSKGQVTAVSNVAVAGGFSNMTVYTANATWTVPAGVTRCKVTAVGAGAGGASSSTYNSAGGGAGGTCIGYIAVVPATTAAVVVGIGGIGGAQQGQAPTSTRGGNTTFTYSSTILFAGGGNTTQEMTPAAGGTASGGTLNIKGGDGGGTLGGSNGNGGQGGSSSLGGNGGSGSSSGWPGTPGTNGGGGGGAGTSGSSGAGGDGIVIIEY